MKFIYENKKAVHSSSVQTNNTVEVMATTNVSNAAYNTKHTVSSDALPKYSE